MTSTNPEIYSLFVVVIETLFNSPLTTIKSF